MQKTDISFLVRGLLFESPMIVVWLAGLVLALVCFRRSPVAALLAFVACGLELLQSFAGNVIFYLLYDSDRISLTDIDMINLLRYLLSAFAWVLILCAVFFWRNQPQAIPEAPVAQPAPGPGPRDLPPGAFRR